MQIVSAVAGVAALLTLAATPADACSLMEGMDATVYPTAQKAGHRPWIQVMGMERHSEVMLVVVDKKCPKQPTKPCTGKTVPYERAGDILRPSENLPSRARVQIQRKSDDGIRIVDEFFVRTTKPTSALPAWEGATVADTEWIDPANTGCGDGGVRIGIAVAATKANLDDTLLLFYTAKPDPAHPEKGLLDMSPPNDMVARPAWSPSKFDPGGDDVPAKAWIMLSDGDGHVGEPIEIAPVLSAESAKKLAAKQAQRSKH
jgi:hypothetical protein